MITNDENMKTRILITILLALMLAPSACTEISSDHTGPIISDIAASNNVLVISDCLSTSITITAKVTDSSDIANVLFWYRVGPDQGFKSDPMQVVDDLYSVVIKGTDLQGYGYGDLEFYISAQDAIGNLNKSAVDNHVQFLPCVNN